MTFWPFDLDGTQFLKLYALLCASAFIMSLILGRLARPAGREQRLTDPDQIALLGGGKTRLAETIVTRLMINGAITPHGKNHFRLISKEAAAGGIDRDIAEIMPAQWHAIESRIAHYAETLDDRLTNLGLFMTNDESRRVSLSFTLPYLAVICLGFVRLIQGMINDKPVGFLVVSIVLTSGLAIFLTTSSRCTLAGLATVKAAKRTSERLNGSATSPEMPMAVALFGTAVLAGSVFEPLHTMRHPSDSGGYGGISSDGGDSSGGCGGCGGGGCGG
jgi:uncharacterized protein (TIGR04222 family)